MDFNGAMWVKNTAYLDANPNYINLFLCRYLCIYIYIPGKPTCAKLSLEIRNSNNYRRLLKFSSFPVFFAVSVCTFWALDFFRRFVGFFRRFVGFFSPFQNRQTHAKDKKCKNCLAAEKSAASNNSWKGNNFTYIGRRRYAHHSPSVSAYLHSGYQIEYPMVI